MNEQSNGLVSICRGSESFHFPKYELVDRNIDFKALQPNHHHIDPMPPPPFSFIGPSYEVFCCYIKPMVQYSSVTWLLNTPVNDEQSQQLWFKHFNEDLMIKEDLCKTFYGSSICDPGVWEAVSFFITLKEENAFQSDTPTDK